mmetsp:Transcript_34516/g.63039  ORF Transcript_34516/g.63039 Transcript_34516/m.63039 type:complete len:248 (+) Transcript_34516:170-913(+)
MRELLNHVIAAVTRVLSGAIEVQSALATKSLPALLEFCCECLTTGHHGILVGHCRPHPVDWPSHKLAAVLCHAKMVLLLLLPVGKPSHGHRLRPNEAHVLRQHFLEEVVTWWRTFEASCETLAPCTDSLHAQRSSQTSCLHSLLLLVRHFIMADYSHWQHRPGFKIEDHWRIGPRGYLDCSFGATERALLRTLEPCCNATAVVQVAATCIDNASGFISQADHTAPVVRCFDYLERLRHRVFSQTKST